MFAEPCYRGISAFPRNFFFHACNKCCGFMSRIPKSNKPSLPRDDCEIIVSTRTGSSPQKINGAGRNDSNCRAVTTRESGEVLYGKNSSAPSSFKLTVVKPNAGLTANSGTVERRPVYGEIEDSDLVHDEIRQLGDEVKQVITHHFQRHGTEENQVFSGIRQFGPSKQSKKMLNKENEAARLAHEKGIYVVWRLTEEPRLRGANNDFCCRIGARHRCFCGHSLACHQEPTHQRGSLTQKHPCHECGCQRFQYIPNEPEEIGEGWLTRRRNWDPSKWSAKCRCGHDCKEHDPRTLGCKACGCSCFSSHFLCVVCDMPWEAHVTIYETEAERHKSGFPVRQDFFPLSNIDWDVRELVLKDATGGGALKAPPGYALLQGTGNRGQRGVRGIPNPRVEEIQDREEILTGGVLAYENANYCPSCATIYKDDGDTCTRCGRARPGRR